MELLHTLQDEEEKGLTPVDNWKASDCMYLEDMGFKNDGTYHYALKKPEIKLSHKKGEGFIIDDKTKNEKKVVKTFKELEDNFVNYKQKWENEPYETQGI
jgi:hypothetical protein